MTQVFLSYLVTSLIGTAAALVFLIIKPLTKKCFSASWNYYAWLLVLLVMMVPLKCDVQNIMPKDNELVSIMGEAGEEVRFEEAKITVNENIPSLIAKEPPFFIENVSLFANIWLLGLAIIITGKVIRYKLFLRMVLKKSYEVQIESIGKNVNVRVMKEAKSPFVIGWVKPILVLPDRDIPKVQLENILAHELTHIRRGDILYKCIVTICKAIHWFNPFMYLIAGEIEKDCEISCDEVVVKNMSDKEKRTYADTLLTFVFEYGRTPAFTTGMAASKEIFKKRLVAIKHSKRKSKINIGISVCVLLILIFCFTFVSAFAGGALLPELENSTYPALYFDEENSLYGYKDNDGNVIVPPKYLKAGEFYEDAALVILPENPDVLRVIKPDGEYLFDKAFSAVNNFNSGYALVVANDEGEYSYINKKGELATELLFEKAENFDSGFASVVLNGQSGIVDTLFNFYPDEE